MLSVPSALRLPRNSLEQKVQYLIDNFLKTLKAHTRHASSLLELHASEVAVLERIYYKGKNQHGSSLHWQRVCEARRFGKRLQDTEMNRAMRDLRTFFYEEGPASSKRLRGPWTCYPSASRLHTVIKRISACVKLLEKTQARLLEVYRWFSIFMQNGQFLQTTVTLCAVASRLHQISVDLTPILRAICNETFTIYSAIYTEKASGLQHLIPALEARPSNGSQASSAPILSARGDVDDLDDTEDLGTIVARVEISPPEDNGVSPPISSQHLTFVAAPQNPQSVAFSALPSTAAITVKERKVPGESRQVTAKTRKPKKVRMDIIDDIFS